MFPRSFGILVLLMLGCTCGGGAAADGSQPGLAFVPVAPCRLMDTRPSEGKSGLLGPPALRGGTTRDIPVPLGGCNIPPDAKAYSLNVTVVPRGPLGYVSLYPTGQLRPNVSTLNAFEGQIIANAAIVPAGANGFITAYVSGDTDLILDGNGFFTDPASPGALVFYPITGCRLADTRASSRVTGPLGGPPLEAGVERSFPLRSAPCVPVSAGAYVLNITVVPHGPLDYVTAWPAGSVRPLVSVQNSPSGYILANAAIVPAGSGGAIGLFAPQATDVLIDLSGYFAPPGQPGALLFYPLPPCRLADTRAEYGFGGLYGPPLLAANVGRYFTMVGQCGIPDTAAAFSLNLTVAPTGPLAFAVLYSTRSIPAVSTLNAFEGQVAANAAIVPVGPAGAIAAVVTSPANIILDVNGYFAP